MCGNAKIIEIIIAPIIMDGLSADFIFSFINKTIAMDANKILNSKLFDKIDSFQ
jgi:hypothetical protein